MSDPNKLDDIFRADVMLDSLYGHWEKLTPEKRRVAAIKIRNIQSKSQQKAIYGLLAAGVLFAVFTIFSWLDRFNLSQASSAGVIIGLVLSIFVIKYAKATRVKSLSEVFPNDFTNDDILAYLQKRERIDKINVKQWEKKKYLIVICTFIFPFLLALHFTEAVTFMSLSSGLSIFLIGISIEILFNFNQKDRK